MTKKLQSPIQKIEDPLFTKQGIELHIKREDLLHPTISGNKWRKLKYNVIEALEHNYDTLLTFGGAYSNHIAATAAAGEQFNLKTIGIIRGDELKENENHTLRFAQEIGMQLVFVSRDEYKLKTEPAYLESLKERLGNFYLVPEGGANNEGITGCTEILYDVDESFTHICCACGTGTTLAGLIIAAKEIETVLGFPALKGGDFLKKDIETMVKEYTGKTKNHPFQLITDYHFGGYAKYNDELIGFIKGFYQKQNIPLDFIYTGKMLYGIYDLAKKGYFTKGSKILAIHTGGLQGNDSIPELKDVS